LRSQQTDTWEEERWYADYMVGRCLLYIDEQRGVEHLLNCAKQRPRRGEPLKALADWFNNRLPTTLPENECLFVDMSAYRC
jgi:hypothetical protein